MKKTESDSALLARIDERTRNTATHVSEIRKDLNTKYVTKAELKLVENKIQSGLALSQKEFAPTNVMFKEIVKYTIIFIVGATLTTLTFVLK